MSQSSDHVARDPIDVFLEEQRLHGRTQRTCNSYEHILTDFARCVTGHERPGREITTVDRTDCMEWVHDLRTGHKESTIATYASTVHRFYRYMVDVGEFDTNPMTLVVEQLEEGIDTDPIRRDISLTEMRTFVGGLNHPLRKAVVVTFLKTGIRVGELCNLDIRDIQLPSVTDRSGTESSRGQLESHEAAIFVPNEPQLGDEYHGEVRTASNKRQRSTIIPVDNELAQVLRSWFLIRPDPISPANPVFLNANSAWGKRLTPDNIRYHLRTAAKANGWYEHGGDPSENVTPHYFRHFFTTHLRDRVGDRGIVKYLRGDVADDVIDTYTHNWGDRVRRRYLDHIYSIL